MATRMKRLTVGKTKGSGIKAKHHTPNRKFKRIKNRGGGR